jgi:hypothetical protein
LLKQHLKDATWPRRRHQLLQHKPQPLLLPMLLQQLLQSEHR